MVQCVLDYIHISLENLEKAEKVQLQAHHALSKFAHYFFAWWFKG